MEVGFKKPGYVAVTVLLTIGFFGIATGYFLRNDFWQDEIYTLHHFVFVPWKTVFTDYHSTNNHIVFNVAVKAFTQLCGILSLNDAVERPHLIRLVPFLFAWLSVVCFYFGLKKHYGKTVALAGVSVLCTSIVFVDFATQVRGYSLSILLTILQFFTLLRIAKGNRHLSGVMVLFLLNVLNLLCLPTNIYLTLSTLTFCFLLIVWPSLAVLFFNKKVPRHTVVSSITAMIVSVLLVSVYYKWLLQLQPENRLITSYDAFSLRNALQALAVFYHFVDYRLYLYLFLLFLSVLYFRKTWHSYTTLLLPAFFFFVPFLFFFFHGAIIIQRIFLPFLPFFALINAAAIAEIFSWSRWKHLLFCVCLANIIVLGMAFSSLLTGAREDNRLSSHKHDLRQHYYLVNFNAREVALLARKLTGTTRFPVVVWDDFGGTGIFYYLKLYQVPFIEYAEQLDLNRAALLLTNNKRDTESELLKQRIPYTKLLSDEKQYNLYVLNPTRLPPGSKVTGMKLSGSSTKTDFSSL